MDLKSEIDIAKSLVSSGYGYAELANHFAAKKLYHTVALLIFTEVFKVDLSFAREQIYSHEYYFPFQNESNPFNSDFIDG